MSEPMAWPRIFAFCCESRLGHCFPRDRGIFPRYDDERPELDPETIDPDVKGDVCDKVDADTKEERACITKEGVTAEIKEEIVTKVRSEVEFCC